MKKETDCFCLGIAIFILHIFRDVYATQSCETHRFFGATNDGNYEIDPDQDGPLAPFTVWCDFSTVPATASVSHSREVRTKAGLVADANSRYNFTVEYWNASVSQIRSLTQSSLKCSYSFKYECYNVWMGCILLTGYDGANHAEWWVKHAEGLCKGDGCNCDKNDDAWRMDEGLILFREVFPIRNVLVCDTDNTGERAYLTLGPLICQSKPPLKSVNIHVIPSLRYIGPVETSVVFDRVCSLLECASLCVQGLVMCPAAGFNKQNCTCHLYDENYYATSNENERNSNWDLIKTYNLN